MKPVSFILFFIFSGKILFGQKDFKSGYIINQELDTLSGWIEYRNWNKNPDHITFTKDGDTKKTIYYPWQIKGFAVEGLVYKSAEINIDKSSGNIDQLSYTGDLELTKDTVFLQVIITGSKTLYYLKDSKNRADFFFIDAGGKKVEWLVFKSYFTEDAEGRKMIVRNSGFQQQLSEYLSECQTLQQKVTRADYKQESLKKIFNDYYSCLKEKPLFQEKPEKTYLETGVIAGAGFTQLKFSEPDNGRAYISKATFKKSKGVAGGAYFNISLARNLKRIFIYNELLYSYYKTTGEYIDFHNPDYYQNNIYEIGFSFIKINMLLRYRIPFDKAGLFCQAGISNGFITKATNSVKTETRFYSQFSNTNGKLLENTKKYQVAILAGVGAQVSRFSFEVRYENSNSIAESFSAITNSLYLLLGFRL